VSYRIWEVFLEEPHKHTVVLYLKIYKNENVIPIEKLGTCAF
jgi:hypothetical protein